ncbi:MAG: hypothetical protein AAFV26_10890 [Pseudomonadota bacterium]
MESGVGAQRYARRGWLAFFVTLIGGPIAGSVAVGLMIGLAGLADTTIAFDQRISNVFLGLGIGLAASIFGLILGCIPALAAATIIGLRVWRHGTVTYRFAALTALATAGAFAVGWMIAFRSPANRASDAIMMVAGYTAAAIAAAIICRWALQPWLRDEHQSKRPLQP